MFRTQLQEPWLEGEGNAGFSSTQDTGMSYMSRSGCPGSLEPGARVFGHRSECTALIQYSCLEPEQGVAPGLQPPPSSSTQCTSPWQCLCSARTPRQCQAHRPLLLLWTICQLCPETAQAPTGTKKAPLSGNQLKCKECFLGLLDQEGGFLSSLGYSVELVKWQLLLQALETTQQWLRGS